MRGISIMGTYGVRAATIMLAMDMLICHMYQQLKRKRHGYRQRGEHPREHTRHGIDERAVAPVSLFGIFVWSGPGERGIGKKTVQ